MSMFESCMLDTFYPANRKEADQAIMAIYVIDKLDNFVEDYPNLHSEFLTQYLNSYFNYNIDDKTVGFLRNGSLCKIHKDTYISSDHVHSESDIEKLHKMANDCLIKFIYEKINFILYQVKESKNQDNRTGNNIEHVQTFRDQKPIVPQPHPR